MHEKLVGHCKYDDVLPLIDCRAQNRLPENAKSVIVMLFPYYTGAFPHRNVSRYALPDDYHGVGLGYLNAMAEALKKAHPSHGFAAFADVSPIREVEAARLAGLGVVGRNGLLINRKYGSWVFIGEIVTTLSLNCEPPKEATCLQCGKCESACPVGAISREGPPRAERCLSRISQKKGELTPEERELLKKHGKVWGCDICQDVCPHNRDAKITPIEAFKKDIIPILTTENLDAALKTKPYSWRGKDVLLRNLGILAE